MEAAMLDRRTIEIDFDIHKRIEAEKRSFQESDNAALRRLLKMSQSVDRLAEAAGGDWFDEGVRLPHGTEVRMTYNKRLHSGRIEDGKWIVEGSNFSSPSAAAGSVARTKKGEKTNLDGWKYWEVKFPNSSSWKPLRELRWV
jgi:hypothetical protein